MTKPRTAAGYQLEFLTAVRATCLYVATKVGDLLDEVVVVGGLVPSLIIDQDGLSARTERHVGTLDLDIGLAVAVLDQKRYQALTERLRHAGFSPDTNEKGNRTRQRWAIDGPPRVTVDFLIPPTLTTDKGGAVRDIEPDFAAIIAPGLRLAFTDRIRVRLSGKTIKNETADREVWVCGPAALVLLKALAFRSRGENKDAYDLFYVLQHFGSGLGDVVERFAALRADRDAAQALVILEEDFSTLDSLGPRRVSEFLLGQSDEALQADVVGSVLAFVRACRRT